MPATAVSSAEAKFTETGSTLGFEQKTVSTALVPFFKTPKVELVKFKPASASSTMTDALLGNINCAPAVGLDKLTVNVKLLVARGSWRTGTVIDWIATPGLNVNTPLMAV